MKLYDGGRAPNPRRVRVFLAEKGIEIPLVPIDMDAMGHKSAEMTGRNPLRRLPVLELDDGTVLTESIAICRYFEELHPEPALFGKGAFGRAKVEEWQRRMELDFLFRVAQAFRHTHPAMKEWEVPQVAEWGEANRPKVVDFLTILDGELAHREFAAGDAFSIADITGIEMPDNLANVRRWYSSLAARPSAKA
jgi:glutathione S-transferase